MARRQRPSGGAPLQQRAALAQESARLIVEHGIADYRRALRKAAERLGVGDPALLPRIDEIEQAVRERQRLFGGPARQSALQQRRRAALEAMQFLASFDPRLAGAVLDGTADAHSAVQLHLFSDDPDAVSRFLQDHRIPHTTGARTVVPEPDRRDVVPLHGFDADGIGFELLVFPADGLRQAPLDASGERPLARASRASLLRIVENEGEAEGPLPR